MFSSLATTCALTLILRSQPSQLDLRSSSYAQPSILGPSPSAYRGGDVPSPFGAASPPRLPPPPAAPRTASSPYAERGFSHPQPMYPAPSVPLSHPYGSDSGSDYQPSAAATIPALSGFAMTHSNSRDGFTHQSPPSLGHVHPHSAATAAAALAAHGLSTAARREREIPIDRGGYVKPGYAEASARGAISLGGMGLGGVGTTGVSTPNDPSEEISTIFVVGFPEDMME